MDYEDLFAFAYPALLISGVLISLIPAYIASKNDKSFWRWWISTASIFTILLLFIIKAQAISLSVYLLVILPIASILAILPKLECISIEIPLNLSTETKLAYLKSALLFIFGLIVMLLVGVIFYYYFRSNGKDYGPYTSKTYFITSVSVFFIACLGLTSFVLIVFNRRIFYIITSFLLILLFSQPFFLKPSRAYGIVHVTDFFIRRDFFLGVVVTDLIAKPIAGVFVLMGVCAGCVAVFMVLNDKYEFINIIISLIDRIILNTPYIHFSKIPATPVLVYYLLYIIFFMVFFHPTEGWIFLLPLVWLCLILPMSLLAFAGAIFSTIVIGISINQQKNLYALSIFLCGLLANWERASTPLYRNFFGWPGALFMFYGVTSGLIALIFWVISDYRNQGKIDGV